MVALHLLYNALRPHPSWYSNPALCPRLPARLPPLLQEQERLARDAERLDQRASKERERELARLEGEKRKAMEEQVGGPGGGSGGGPGGMGGTCWAERPSLDSAGWLAGARIGLRSLPRTPARVQKKEEERRLREAERLRTVGQKEARRAAAASAKEQERLARLQQKEERKRCAALCF